MIFMSEKKPVRLVSWVSPKQKAKIRKTAKNLAKIEKRHVSDSEIIRTLIDKE